MSVLKVRDKNGKVFNVPNIINFKTEDIDKAVAEAKEEVSNTVEKAEEDINKAVAEAKEQAQQSLKLSEDIQKYAQEVRQQAESSQSSAALSAELHSEVKRYKEEAETSARQSSELARTAMKWASYAQTSKEEAQTARDEAVKAKDDSQQIFKDVSYQRQAFDIEVNVAKTEIDQKVADANNSATNAETQREMAYLHSQDAKGFSEGAQNYAVMADLSQINAKESENKAKKYAESVKPSLLSNALKGKADAVNAMRIDDVSPIEHDIKVKASSKNLFYNTFRRTNETYNGLTFNAEEGQSSFYVHGTSNNIGSFKLSQFYLKAGTYTLSLYGANTISSVFDRIYISYVGSSGEIVIANDILTNASKSFILDNDAEVIIRFVFAQGSTYENKEICIQVEEGTVATAYTPYVDVSAAKVLKQGKNLIPYPYEDGMSKTYNGITFTVNEDRSITVNGTATAQSYFVVNQKTNFPIGKYALSGCAKGGSLNTYFMTGNGFDAVADTGNNNGRLEVLPSSPQTNVVIVISSGYTANNLVFKPQLEVGTVATNYEPYIEPIEYAISADGTVEGVNSLCPTTTLVPDTNGVLIEAEYNRDTNIVIASLQAQIDELKAMMLNLTTN
jgi:hypothetical protein